MRRRLLESTWRAALAGAALLACLTPGAMPAGEASDPFVAVFAKNPPPGHTGGFGEPTCQACHTDAELNHPDATLSVEGLPDRYAAGAAYRITVTLTGLGQERSGFQASLRFADGPQRGLQAGYLGATDERVNVAMDSLSSVQYAVHSEEGAQLVGNERGTWVVEWTAPPSGASVVLHVAANSANGDNSPFGDLIHTLEQVSEGSGDQPSG